MSWTYEITDSVPWSHRTAVDNANEIYNYFNGLGFTPQSIYGIIGNMEHESYLNPGQQEIGYGGSTRHGYGLIQWTPATVLVNAVAPANWYDGSKQCKLVNSEGSTSAWIPTISYPYSWSEFSQLTNIEEATKAYAYERERAGVVSMESRIEHAIWWSNNLHPVPPTPTATRRKMPVWMMLRRW